MSTRNTRPLRRGTARLAKDERGSATIETLLITPLLLLLILAIVQGATYFNARTTAHSVADTAYQEQRLYGAEPNDGLTAANDLLDDVTAIENGAATVTQSPTTVTVTVTGVVPTIVPGIDWTITSVVTGPRERWAD